MHNIWIYRHYSKRTRNRYLYCTNYSTKTIKEWKELLKINPNTTQVELSDKLNVSRRIVLTILVNLKEKGKIERFGSDRKGYWKILI